MIKRLVKLSFQEDKIEEFIEIFEHSKDRIRARKGCQHVELLQVKHSKNIFFTLSIWTDEAALDAYRASELFASTWAKTKILFNDKPEAWSVDYLGEGTSLL